MASRHCSSAALKSSSALSTKRKHIPPKDRKNSQPKSEPSVFVRTSSQDESRVGRKSCDHSTVSDTISPARTTAAQLANHPRCFTRVHQAHANPNGTKNRTLRSHPPQPLATGVSQSRKNPVRRKAVACTEKSKGKSAKKKYHKNSSQGYPASQGIQNVRMSVRLGLFVGAVQGFVISREKPANLRFQSDATSCPRLSCLCGTRSRKRCPRSQPFLFQGKRKPAWFPVNKTSSGYKEPRGMLETRNERLSSLRNTGTKGFTTY